MRKKIQQPNPLRGRIGKGKNDTYIVHTLTRQASIAKPCTELDTDNYHFVSDALKRKEINVTDHMAAFRNGVIIHESILKVI
jgi:hypothetical protein